MKQLSKALKLVIMLVIFSGNFVPLWKPVHADTQERIQVKKVKSLDEMDVNLKNWEDYTENNKMSLVKNAVTGAAIFCMEPKKEYPSNDSYLTVKSQLENKRVANLILNYQNQKEYIAHLDEDAQYAATQCAIFYTVSGDNDDLEVDPVVDKLINYANSLPDPIEKINNFSLKLEPAKQELVKNGNKYTANYSINTEAAKLTDAQVSIKSNNQEAQSKAAYTIKNNQLEISLPEEIVNNTQTKIELEVNLTTKLADMLQLSGYLVPDQASRQHMATIQAFQITSSRLYSANAKAEVSEKPKIPEEPEKPKVPEIQTKATNAKDNTKIIPAEEKVQIKDIVTYQNLLPGKEYELQGKLMDKETGNALLINGKEVTASKKFTPTKETGEEALLFEFNASALPNKKIVVFEELKQAGEQVAVHNNITDINQTVEVSEKPKVPEEPRKPNVPKEPSTLKIPAEIISKSTKNQQLPATGELKTGFFAFLGLFFSVLSVILLNYRRIIGKNKN